MKRARKRRLTATTDSRDSSTQQLETGDPAGVETGHVCHFAYLDGGSGRKQRGLRWSYTRAVWDDGTGPLREEARTLTCLRERENVAERNRETTLAGVAFHGGRRAQFLVHRRRYLKCIPPRTSGSSRVYVTRGGKITGRACARDRGTRPCLCSLGSAARFLMENDLEGVEFEGKVLEKFRFEGFFFLKEDFIRVLDSISLPMEIEFLRKDSI